MEKLKIPPVKVANLEKETKEVLFAIFKVLAKKMLFNCDLPEEEKIKSFAELLDKGFLQVFYDVKIDEFNFKIYDPEIMEYKIIGEKSKYSLSEILKDK